MKRLALAATVALALACASAPSVAVTQSQPKSTLKPAPVPVRCTIAAFRPFSAAVWRLNAWRRGKPPARVIEALRRRLGCAPPHHRVAMKRTWRRDKAAFYAYRSYRRRNPFYGCTSYSGCQFYAIPAYIVECESGGRFHDPSAPNGAYSMLDSIRQGVPTWESWRPSWASGYAEPYQAPRRAQDEAAEALWDADGSEPWECA